jgi:hypothetical protein
MIDPISLKTSTYIEEILFPVGILIILLYLPKVMGFIITPFEALPYGTALKLAVASKYPLIRSYVNIIEGFVE